MLLHMVLADIVGTAVCLDTVETAGFLDTVDMAVAWDRLSCIGDTAAAWSKARMHLVLASELHQDSRKVADKPGLACTLEEVLPMLQQPKAESLAAEARPARLHRTCSFACFSSRSSRRQVT